MSVGLADTTVFIARESERAIEEALLPDQLAVSIITIGELRAGVRSASDVASRDRRLATLTMAIVLDPVPIDDGVAEHWSRLRIALRDSNQRMPVNDSWIAATAMSLGVAIVTKDDDYVQLDILPFVRV